jgi:hypothetical protein
MNQMQPIYFRFPPRIIGCLVVAQSGLGTVRTAGIGAGVLSASDTPSDSMVLPAVVILLTTVLKIMLDKLIEVSEPIGHNGIDAKKD